MAALLYTSIFQIDGDDQITLRAIEAWHQYMQHLFPHNSEESTPLNAQVLDIAHFLIGDQLVIEADQPFVQEAYCTCGIQDIDIHGPWESHIPPPSLAFRHHAIVFVRHDDRLAYAMETLQSLLRLSELSQSAQLLHTVLSAHVIRLFLHHDGFIAAPYMDYMIHYNLLSMPIEDHLRAQVSQMIAGNRASMRVEQSEPTVSVPPRGFRPLAKVILVLETNVDRTWTDLLKWQFALHKVLQVGDNQLPTPWNLLTNMIVSEQIRVRSNGISDFWCVRCHNWERFSSWYEHNCGGKVNVKFSGPQQTTASVKDVLSALREHRSVDAFKDAWYAVTQHTLILARCGLLERQTVEKWVRRQLLDGDAFDRESLDMIFATGI